MKNKMKKNMRMIIPALFFLFFFFLPLSEVVKSAVSIGGEVKINWLRIRGAVWFTFWQALVSTLITLVLAMPCAYIFGRFKFPGKKIFSAMFTIPFVLPTVVAAAGFSALLGPRGWLNIFLMDIFHLSDPPVKLMNTIWIILLAHVFFNISVAIRIVSNSWAQMDVKYEYAARCLGADSWEVFVKTTLPLLRSSILSSGLLVFLFDFSSYGVILLLGGPRFRTIEVEIAHQTLQQMNLHMAGVLSLIQMLFTISISLLEKWAEKKVRYNRSPRMFEENLRPLSSRKEKISAFLIMGGLALFLMAPLIALIFKSFYIHQGEIGRSGLSAGWSTVFYEALLENKRKSAFYAPPIRAIWNSLSIALIASSIAVFVGLIYALAKKRSGKNSLLDLLLMLPIGSSSVTLGLGYILFFAEYIHMPIITAMAHSLIAFPLVIRTIQSALEKIPDTLRYAGMTLGGTNFQTFWRVELPLMRRSIISAFIFAFTISLGEFGATSFISRPERPTIPVAIYRLLGQPGAMNYGQAMALSVILMTFCFLAVLSMENNQDSKI